MIKKIPLCKSQQRDVLTWSFTLDGDYMVKLGYKFLQNETLQQKLGPSNTDSMKPLWIAIWSLDIPGKVRNFVWRSCKNSLPTETNLMQRKALKENLCEQCKSHQEDVLHALYGCLKLVHLWNKKTQWNRNTLKQATTFTDFFKIILAEKAKLELFCWVVWNLWNCRSNLRLGEPTYNLVKVLEKAVVQN